MLPAAGPALLVIRAEGLRMWLGFMNREVSKITPRIMRVFPKVL